MSTVNPEIQQIQQAINETTVEAERAKVGEQEIKLETGEVFKGTPSEILDKLKASKVEASRAIQERNREIETLKAQLASQQQPTQQNPPAADHTQYFETWAKNPNKATVQALASEMGIDPDEFLRITKMNMESSSINNASAEFTRRRPDFPNDPASGMALKEFVPAVMQRQGIRTTAGITADVLELAYQDAIRAGKIQPQQVTINATVNQGSPLPNLRGTSAPMSTETEILSQASTMPLDQLKQLVDKLRQQQG